MRTTSFLFCAAVLLAQVLFVTAQGGVACPDIPGIAALEGRLLMPCERVCGSNADCVNRQREANPLGPPPALCCQTDFCGGSSCYSLDGFFVSLTAPKRFGGQEPPPLSYAVNPDGTPAGPPPVQRGPDQFAGINTQPTSKKGRKKFAKQLRKLAASGTKGNQTVKKNFFGTGTRPAFLPKQPIFQPINPNDPNSPIGRVPLKSTLETNGKVQIPSNTFVNVAPTPPKQPIFIQPQPQPAQQPVFNFQPQPRPAQQPVFIPPQPQPRPAQQPAFNFNGFQFPQPQPSPIRQPVFIPPQPQPRPAPRPSPQAPPIAQLRRQFQGLGGFGVDEFGGQ